MPKGPEANCSDSATADQDVKLIGRVCFVEQDCASSATHMHAQTRLPDFPTGNRATCQHRRSASQGGRVLRTATRSPGGEPTANGRVAQVTPHV